MARILVLAYGSLSYLVFFVTFLYLFAFAGDLGVAKSVSAGGPLDNTIPAILKNLALIFLFGFQHSVMARPTFKRWWTKWVPDAIERSTYVLITSIIFILMFVLWEPLPRTFWNVRGTLVGSVLWAVFFAGALIVLVSSFMINHFDLFGLRQTFLYFLGKPCAPLPFQVTGFYKGVRNPLMLGFLLSFWAAPTMTLGRLIFAAGMTVYIFVGIYFEERNNGEYLGEPYLRYQRKTPMIIPFLKGKE